jgi:hypothetical protein
MQIPPMRPTFAIDFPIESTDAMDRLCSLVQDADYPIEGRVAGNHLMLVIPPSQRHFWSPWLHLEVHEHSDGATVKGRFSPNPSVWTGFMLTYIALATLVFFAGMFGISQWVMDKPPSALMLAVIPLLIGIVMYWSSLIGQRIAHAQMQELYDATMHALEPES